MASLPPKGSQKHAQAHHIGHVLGLHDMGVSSKGIATATKIPRTTVRRIIRRGTVQNSRQNQPVRYLDEETTQRLADECMRDKERQNQPWCRIADELGIREPKTVVKRSLKRAGLVKVLHETRRK